VFLGSTYKFATFFTVLHVRWNRHTPCLAVWQVWQALVGAGLVWLGNPERSGQVLCGCEAWTI